MRRWLAVVVLISGCYRSHEHASSGPEGCDPAARPLCMHRDGACDPYQLVDASCVGTSWECLGAMEYASPWTEDRCLPLLGEPLFPDGVHESPVPVPIGDECVWVFPEDTPQGIRLVGAQSASSCDAIHLRDGALEGPHADGSFFALEGSFDTPSGTRVLGRFWRFDASSPFGVRSFGMRIGRVESSQISFEGPLSFGETFDFGDAAIAIDGSLYAYGCPGSGLEEDCLVARVALDRVDERDAWEIFGRDGWNAGPLATIFTSGPHRSAVIEDPRGAGLLHLYTPGFGRELHVQSAPLPEGPWTAAITLAACELPADDPDAYCAGPQVHRELSDPLDPSSIFVSYSVGSTAPDQSERRMINPEAYWPRVVRIRLP